MTKNRLLRPAALTALLSLLLGAAFPVRALTLPQSPAGYSWQQMRDLKAAVLKPDGWSFDSRVSGNRYQYRLMKEKQDPRHDGAGGTRLTIVARRMSGPDGTEGVGPSRFTATLFEEIKRNRDLERTQSAVQGPFETIRYQYVAASDESAPVREYSLLVANDATGTIYIVTFQAPLTDWENDWRTVTVILDRIFLDDEI